MTTKTPKTDSEILDLVCAAASARVAVLLRTPGSDLDLTRARAGKSIRGMDSDILDVFTGERVSDDRMATLVDACDAAYLSTMREAAQ
jgi:hypothetical protein